MPSVPTIPCNRRIDGEAMREILRSAGLRPTHQRIMLLGLIFTERDLHLTPESLLAEARRAGLAVSFATIYNTLHRLTEKGLLRQIFVGEGRSFFDPDVSNHHHFLVEGEGVIDIGPNDVSVDRLPAAPDGMEIVRVDLLVRLRRKQAGGADQQDECGRPPGGKRAEDP